MFRHFWARPNLGHKCMPQNLMTLIIRLLCCYYKSFITELDGRHLSKYLYIYITFRNMHICSRTFKPLSTKM